MLNDLQSILTPFGLFTELYASVDLVDLTGKHLVNGKGILARKQKIGGLVLKLKAPSCL